MRSGHPPLMFFIGICASASVDHGLEKRAIMCQRLGFFAGLVALLFVDSLVRGQSADYHLFSAKGAVIETSDGFVQSVPWDQLLSSNPGATSKSLAASMATVRSAARPVLRGVPAANATSAEKSIAAADRQDKLMDLLKPIPGTSTTASIKVLDVVDETQVFVKPDQDAFRGKYLVIGELQPLQLVDYTAAERQEIARINQYCDDQIKSTRFSQQSSPSTHTQLWADGAIAAAQTYRRTQLSTLHDIAEVRSWVVVFCFGDDVSVLAWHRAETRIIRGAVQKVGAFVNIPRGPNGGGMRRSGNGQNFTADQAKDASVSFEVVIKAVDAASGSTKPSNPADGKLPAENGN